MPPVLVKDMHMKGVVCIMGIAKFSRITVILNKSKT